MCGYTRRPPHHCCQCTGRVSLLNCLNCVLVLMVGTVSKPASPSQHLWLLMRCRRRPTSGTANPRGGKDPYVSPDGHNICDARFYEGLKLFGEDAPVSGPRPHRGVSVVLFLGGIGTCAHALQMAEEQCAP